MIPALIIAAVACLALAYVLGPMKKGARAEPEPDPAPTQAAEEKKTAALIGLIDLEQELHTGKLSAEDFMVLRDEYEREALAALTELDISNARRSLDDDLEAEIAAARERLTCPECGAPRDPSRGTCTRCDA